MLMRHGSLRAKRILHPRLPRPRTSAEALFFFGFFFSFFFFPLIVLVFFPFSLPDPCESADPFRFVFRLSLSRCGGRRVVPASRCAYESPAELIVLGRSHVFAQGVSGVVHTLITSRC